MIFHRVRPQFSVGPAAMFFTVAALLFTPLHVDHGSRYSVRLFFQGNNFGLRSSFGEFCR